MARQPDRLEPDDVMRQRWQHVDALLDAALDLPVEQRAAFVRDACGADEALYAQLARLLAAAERTDDPLDRAAAALVFPPALLGESLQERGLPARVGPFRILHEIGRGGMGTVFLAEREEFRQTVALKLVRRGLDVDRSLERRFLDERDILARLEHPNIARLLDGGVTPDGLPWFALEYVAGEPIDHYCDRMRLVIDERIRLVCQACRAVAYAHRALVVHRDLKPSNILVTAAGVVKLLDFGIAKLLDAERDHEAFLTRTGARVLTPEYASPEQLNALTVTPASDVYALGVLLYEILTGRSPYLLRRRAQVELERAILEDPPTRPSSVVSQRAVLTDVTPDASFRIPPAEETAALRGTTPERLRRRLRGDLDAIVLQALRKEPERRYATAEALADDLERHLEGRPVSARPDAWSYRAGRFVQRHRTSVAVGAAGLAAGIVLILLLAPRRPQPEPVVVAAPTAGQVLAIGHIADHRAGATAELARPIADMLATNLARTPGLRVVSTARMYELVRQSGLPEDPAPAALASAARRAGATAIVDGSLYELEGGRLRLDLRLIDLASNTHIAAETATGANAFALVDSGTVRLVFRLGARAPTGSLADVTTQSVAAYRFYEEGLRAFTAGEAATAFRLFDAALREDSAFALAAYYAARTAATFRERWVRYARAVALANRTSERERLRIQAGWAVSNYSPAARALLDTLVTRYPDELEGHRLAGALALNQGRYPEAFAALRRAVAMDSLGLRGTGRECTMACEALSEIISGYQQMDSLAAAEREARRWTRSQPAAATPWIWLAALLDQQGRPDEALQAFRRFAARAPEYDRGPLYMAGHRIWERHYDEADRILRDLMLTGNERLRVEAPWYLALSLRQQGRLTEALAAARRYRSVSFDEITESVAPPAALMEAQVLFELGRYAQAAALFDSIAHVTGPPEAPASARAKARVWALTHVATARAALGDTTALAALADTIQQLGSQNSYLRDNLLHHYVRGLLLAARGRFDDAIAEHRAAIASPNFGYTRVNLELARLLLRRGRAREAVVVLQPALRGSLEASNLYVTRTELHALLGEAWEMAGRPDSAAAHYRSVIRDWHRAEPPFSARRTGVSRRLAAIEGRSPQ